MIGMDEVVLIDDASDEEGINKKDDLMTEFNLDSDESFKKTLKSFMEYGCSVIDLVESDSDQEKRKLSSKCMNSYCQSGENLDVAPDFIRSHYGLPKSKNQLVCACCFENAIQHFKDLREKVRNKKPIFEATFPKTNPVVLIDSDDEEETFDKDEELSSEATQILSDSLADCFEKFFENHDCEFQITKSIESLKSRMDEFDKLRLQNKKEYDELEKEAMESMNYLYKSYLGDSVKFEEELIIPYEEMRTMMVKKTGDSRQNGSREGSGSNSESDVVMMATFDSASVAANLPPEGEIIRPKPKAGEKYYVMKVSTFSEWVPAIVEEVVTKTIDGKPNDSYKVQINGGKTKYQKEVIAGHMAYWEPSPVRLPVGTRVIALATGNHKYPKKFFSGITAEHPSNVNGCRYLIFFDDGYAQYANHENVRVVCETKANVAEYFHPNSQDFIRQYLDLFPERLMLKVKLMETIKTEYGGSWYNARVKNIDGALVEMLFVKDFRREWIYRGSTRLYPVYEEAARAKREPNFRHRGTTLRRHPLVYSNLSNTQSKPEGEETEPSPVVPPRAVARKSINREPETRNIPPSWDRKVARLDYGKVEAEFPTALKPLPYKPHNCNPGCVAWTMYSPDKAIGVNPLIVPIMFGFRRLEKNSSSRVVLSGSGYQHTIAYDAPCGKKLRNHDEVFNYLKVTSSQLTVDLFDFDYWVHIYDEYKVPGKFVIIADLSGGNEPVPIPCVNSVDHSVPPYMYYMIKRRGKEGVYLNLDPGFLSCCDCPDDCDDRTKCACWQRTIEGVRATTRNSNIPISSIGYQYRRLPDVVRTGIFECNDRCKCKKTCLNRVVQHPLKLKLQLFKTKRKGWGTRCINDIPAGTFVCVYVGDILTENDANEGGKRFGDEYFAELDYIESVEALKEDYEEDVVNGPSDEEFEPEKAITYAHGGESDDEFEPYIFQSQEKGSRMQLRKRKAKDTAQKNNVNEGSDEESTSSDDSRQPRVPSQFNVPVSSSPAIEEDKAPSVRNYYGKDESVYIMDAKTAGNIGRYLNHSCDPNLFVQNVFVDTHDLRFPWVAFFALRHIKAGTELTWDYRYEVGSVAGKKLYCYCETPECRGRLL